MCRERGARFFCPENSLLVDNATMIAFLGEIMFNNGDYVDVKNIDNIDILPRQRTDQVEIKYR